MADDRGELGAIELPRRAFDPLTAVARRVGFAVGLLVFIATVVFLGRDGYVDVVDDPISILDALYYASVTVTTTGYGDISAVTPGTRLATLVLITPARILFLILVVGTTVEVLTDQYRQQLANRRWRRRVSEQFLVCGFGSTGHSATDALVADGVDPATIVVVDRNPDAIQEANAAGFAAVLGDASQVSVLRQAAVGRAKAVIVTPNRDDTAVLVTLTARELNPDAHIVASVRRRENVHLLEQSGADAVIDASAAVGRLLGLATRTPSALTVIDDILDSGTSLEMAEVAPLVDGHGVVRVPPDVSVIEVRRDGRRLAMTDELAGALAASDRLIVVRPARGEPTR